MSQITKPIFSNHKKSVFVALVFGLGLILLFVTRRSSSSWEEVKVGSIHESVYGLAKVKSRRVFEAKPGVSDSIRRIHFHEGAFVDAKSVILNLHSGYEVRAPFDGVITSLPFHELENVFPQIPVLRLEDLNDLYLEVALEQQGALLVAKNQTVKLIFESLRGITFDGIVDTIYPNQDQFIVRVQPKGQLPKQILPGMTADVVIEVGKKDGVLLIPLAGVSNGTVSFKRGAITKKTALKLGSIDNEWGELIQGDLQIGDQVLIRGRK